MENLNDKELSEIRKLLADLKQLPMPLLEYTERHNHDRNNSDFIATLNIEDNQGKAIELKSTHLFFGKGIRLKNSAAGLPNLGDDEIGTMFFNTAYNEVWVWRRNDADDGNEWKALAWIV